MTIRYGREQRIVLVRGDTRFTRIALDEPRSGSLEIEDCIAGCPRNYAVDVEITTPDLTGIAIKGDGVVRIAGDFPTRDRVGLALKGDGDIDARNLPARHVDVAINGDGRISTTAAETLTVAINGEGTVTYRGNPAVKSVVNGGGAVVASPRH